MKLWIGVLSVMALGGLALQGFNCLRNEARKEKMMETRATAKRLEKATFAAG
jgi:hypothetical protein